MTTFYVHLDAGDHAVVWWAESDEIAGMTLAAESLVDLRRLIEEAVADKLGPEAAVNLVLVDESVPSDVPPRTGDVSPEPARTAGASDARGPVKLVFVN